MLDVFLIFTGWGYEEVANMNITTFATWRDKAIKVHNKRMESQA